MLIPEPFPWLDPSWYESHQSSPAPAPSTWRPPSTEPIPEFCPMNDDPPEPCASPDCRATRPGSELIGGYCRPCWTTRKDTR